MALVAGGQLGAQHGCDRACLGQNPSRGGMIEAERDLDRPPLHYTRLDLQTKTKEASR
jgi:hypothetical protein